MNEEVVKLKQRGVSQSVLENTVDEEDLLFTMLAIIVTLSPSLGTFGKHD